MGSSEDSSQDCSEVECFMGVGVEGRLGAEFRGDDASRSVGDGDLS